MLPSIVLSVLGIAILILSPTDKFSSLARESPTSTPSDLFLINDPFTIDLNIK